MTHDLTIRRSFHLTRNRHGQKELRAGTSPSPALRIPRLARWMALALRMDELIRQGTVDNQAELARLGQVSRARLTQLMNLVLLTPEIQEELLLLSDQEPLATQLTLRQLQPLAAVADWSQQRSRWAQIKAQVG